MGDDHPHLRALLVLLLLLTIVTALWLLVGRSPEPSPGAVARPGEGRYWIKEFRRRWHAERRDGRMRADTIRRLRAQLAEHRARLRTLQAHRVEPVDWAAKQIAAAETLGRESGGDPWPNCPDPYDGSGASWYDTLGCENSGSWFDSPGYYRCGLQFDPMWERRFGRLCP